MGKREINMKSFWHKPPKPKKKKQQSKSATKQYQLTDRKQNQDKWVPPHSIKTKNHATDEPIFIKAPVTHNIPPALMNADGALNKQQSLTEKTIYPKNQQVRKDFLQIFHALTERHRSWEIWSDFVTMTACTISNAVDKSHYEKREQRYLHIICKYNEHEQNLFSELFAFTVLALEENPEQDFLGDLYEELNLYDEGRKQIFTPYHVCHLMADITLKDIVQEIEEKGYIEIHDCCCGAGATLVAATNIARDKLKKAELNYQNHVLVSGQDLDEIVLMMCYIQLSLLGVAGYFKVGNTLTEPITTSDNLDNYWFTPMYFFPVWHYRRIWHRVDQIFEKEKKYE